MVERVAGRALAVADIQVGKVYYQKGTGVLVRVKEVEDTQVRWLALGGYHIDQYTFGVMPVYQFQKQFSLVGQDYRLVA